ncbi:MAG: hypothetical protein AB7K68_01170 [Bacteriovoracia bacterium]
MIRKISPEIERVYSQLRWVHLRTFRIIESVKAHFGREQVSKIIEKSGIGNSPLANEPDFFSLLNEKSAEVFLSELACSVEKYEAGIVTALRRHVSIYREHVDEQILFGSRTAGQEAGRLFLSHSKPAIRQRTHLDVPETVQAVFELTYSGLPGDKNYFLSLRPMGGCSVHFNRSPHLAPWAAVEAEPKFLYGIKSEWICGILDILSPDTIFSTTSSLEHGNKYGLAHFHLRGQHAGP